MTWKNPGRDPAAMQEIVELLGADTANNTMSSTLVGANADGSIYERLEYLQTRVALLEGSGSPATFNPFFGYGVTKTEDVELATNAPLFTLTGKVAIMLWTFEVTNALHTTVTDYKIELTTLAGILIAAGNISSGIVGFMRTLNGSAASTALNTSTSAVSVAGVGDTATKWGPIVVGKAGGSDVIKATRTAGATGDAIVHNVFFWPLEAGASLVAVA